MLRRYLFGVEGVLLTTESTENSEKNSKEFEENKYRTLIVEHAPPESSGLYTTHDDDTLDTVADAACRDLTDRRPHPSEDEARPACVEDAWRVEDSDFVRKTMQVHRRCTQLGHRQQYRN